MVVVDDVVDDVVVDDVVKVDVIVVDVVDDVVGAVVVVVEVVVSFDAIVKTTTELTMANSIRASTRNAKTAKIVLHCPFFGFSSSGALPTEVSPPIGSL